MKKHISGLAITFGFLGVTPTLMTTANSEEEESVAKSKVVFQDENVRVIAGKNAKNYFERLSNAMTDKEEEAKFGDNENKIMNDGFKNGTRDSAGASSKCPDTHYVTGFSFPLGLADKLAYLRKVKYKGDRITDDYSVTFGELNEIACTKKSADGAPTAYLCVINFGKPPADRQAAYKNNISVQNVYQCVDKDY